MEGKKRKHDTLQSIKSKVEELGGVVSGKTKKQLLETLRHNQTVRAMQTDTVPTYKWTEENLTEFKRYLPLSDEPFWDPAEVKLVCEVLNSRSVTPELLEIGDTQEWCNRVLAAGFKLCNPPPRRKRKHISADELDPLTNALFKKKVEKWGDKEGELLLQYMGDVIAIDGRRSSSESIERYGKLLGMLNIFYARRPDIKAKVDPDLVIFDIQAVGVDLDTYLAQLKAYVPPFHLGSLPDAVNPGPIPLIFPMPTNEAANFFIGYMTASVPNLRATLFPDYQGAGIVY